MHRLDQARNPPALCVVVGSSLHSSHSRLFPLSFPPTELCIPILLAAVSGVTPSQSHPWPVSCHPRLSDPDAELPHGWPLILALRAGLNHPSLACESIYFNTVKLVHSLDSVLGLGAKIHADV